MKRSVCFFLLTLCSLLSFGQAPVTTPPDKIYGKLFVDVQMSRVFADGKTFVDCVPKRKPADIVAGYETARTTSVFELKNFFKIILKCQEIPPITTKTITPKVSATTSKTLC